MRLVLAVALALTMVPASGAWTAFAQTTSSVSRGPSGLPLPRFVSLKAERVNMRVGPGKQYAVAWRYVKTGLPLEVIQEYDNWRRVRDAEGTEGWIYHSLLSGERAAAVAPWRRGKALDDPLVGMRREPGAGAAVVARLEPGVIVALEA